MGSLDRRIEALEATYSEGSCPECGWDGDWSKVQIEVVWDELDGDEESEEEGPQFCSGCGHQLLYDVACLDLPNEGEERQL